MIKLSDVRHLHLELSSDCNARCPCCPRNYCGFPYNNGYAETNLSLEKVKLLLPIEVVAQLNEILINGNYGDFVMNPESLDIVAWFREHNPTMKIDISTNGGARDKEFWSKLAQYNPVVFFCIDGLEDTHAIYRQNTVYETVIRNASSFMVAGGTAVWCMTKFDHNKYQIEDARRLSRELGFKTFNLRDSGRDVGPVYDKQGKQVFVMKRANGLPEQITEDFIKQNPMGPMKSEYKPATCEVLKMKSLYISAQGTIDPCCHVGLNKPGVTWWKGDPEFRQGAYPTNLDDGIAWYNKILNAIGTPEQLQACSGVCGQ